MDKNGDGRLSEEELALLYEGLTALEAADALRGQAQVQLVRRVPIAIVEGECGVAFSSIRRELKGGFRRLRFACKKRCTDDDRSAGRNCSLCLIIFHSVDDQNCVERTINANARRWHHEASQRSQPCCGTRACAAASQPSGIFGRSSADLCIARTPSYRFPEHRMMRMIS